MSNSSHVPEGSAPAPRRFLRILAILAGSLALLVLLLVLYENWRGQRAWRQFRAEWEAKGERFDLESLIPKPVPHEENFATTPLLAPLLDYHQPPGQPVQWNDPQGNERARALTSVFKDAGKKKAPHLGQWLSATFTDLEQWQQYFAGNSNFTLAATSDNAPRDVLAALRKFDAELDELSAASLRPHTVFPVRYQDGFNALLPHLSVIKGATQIVRLRATARLAAGQKAEALQDAKLAFRLGEAFKREPFLISQLVRIAIFQIAMQPVWEGLSRHDWSEQQLAELQSTLTAIRVLEDYGPAMRGERAMENRVIDQTRTGRIALNQVVDDDRAKVLTSVGRFVPSGWFYQNQVTLNRLFQEHSLPFVDAAQHRVFVDKTRETDEVPELKETGIYNVFARMLFPALGGAASKFAYSQTAVDLATVACALERHRLAHGKYPEQLDPLVPRFIARIPSDVINGDLLRYRRDTESTFVLYSVGWNETDDGGELLVRKPGTAPDLKRGDWVWTQGEP